MITVRNFDRDLIFGSPNFFFSTAHLQTGRNSYDRGDFKFKEAKKPCRAHATVPGNDLRENLALDSNHLLRSGKKAGLILVLDL